MYYTNYLINVIIILMNIPIHSHSTSHSFQNEIRSKQKAYFSKKDLMFLAKEAKNKKIEVIRNDQGELVWTVVGSNNSKTIDFTQVKECTFWDRVWHRIKMTISSSYRAEFKGSLVKITNAYKQILKNQSEDAKKDYKKIKAQLIKHQTAQSIMEAALINSTLRSSNIELQNSFETKAKEAGLTFDQYLKSLLTDENNKILKEVIGSKCANIFLYDSSLEKRTKELLASKELQKTNKDLKKIIGEPTTELNKNFNIEKINKEKKRLKESQIKLEKQYQLLSNYCTDFGKTVDEMTTAYKQMLEKQPTPSKENCNQAKTTLIKYQIAQQTMEALLIKTTGRRSGRQFEKNFEAKARETGLTFNQYIELLLTNNKKATLKEVIGPIHMDLFLSDDILKNHGKIHKDLSRLERKQIRLKRPVINSLNQHALNERTQLLSKRLNHHNKEIDKLKEQTEIARKTMEKTAILSSCLKFGDFYV